MSHRTARIFISSTFLDMREEREILAKEVFPELRRRARARLFEVVEVDLRWGITEEQCENLGAVRICLEEVRSCRPFFVAILGERYGWIPDSLPGDLADRYAAAMEGFPCSMTELEIALAAALYAEHAARSLVYFRDPGYLETLPPEVIGQFRSASPEQSARLNELKRRLSNAPRKPVVYENPADFGKRITEDLWALLDREFPEAPADDPLWLERQDHLAFATQRAAFYQENPAWTEVLDFEAFWGGVMLVGAAAGLGKSALMANWSLNRTPGDSSGREWIISHYVGASKRSASPWAMIDRLRRELAHCLGEQVPPALSRSAAISGWLDMLEKAGNSSDRFIIVIDGIDQLEEADRAAEFDWLPAHPRINVFIVVSCIEGPLLDRLQEQQPRILRLTPLDAPARADLIDRYLARFRKKLPDSQVSRIVSHPCGGSPLFLTILLNELRVIGHNDQLGEQLGLLLEADSPARLFAIILGRIEEDFKNDAPGVVKQVLSCVAASVNGLTEDEIIELTRAPRMLCSRLYLAFQEWLAVKSGALTFSHRQLRLAVEQRYLTSEREWNEARAAILPIFEHQKMSPRIANEIAWNHRWRGDQPRLLELLSNKEFLRVSLPDDLLQIIDHARALGSRRSGGFFRRIIAMVRSLLKKPASPLDVRLAGHLLELLLHAGSAAKFSAKLPPALPNPASMADPSIAIGALVALSMIHRTAYRIDKALRAIRQAEWIAEKWGVHAMKKRLELALLDLELMDGRQFLPAPESEAPPMEAETAFHCLLAAKSRLAGSPADVFEAMQWAGRAEEIYAALVGRNHPDFLHASLVTLEAGYRLSGQGGDTREALETIDHTLQSRYGKDHPLRIDLCLLAAEIDEAGNRRKEARRHTLEAWRVHQQVHPEAFSGESPSRVAFDKRIEQRMVLRNRLLRKPAVAAWNAALAFVQWYVIPLQYKDPFHFTITLPIRALKVLRFPLLSIFLLLAPPLVLFWTLLTAPTLFLARRLGLHWDWQIENRMKYVAKCVPLVGSMVLTGMVIDQVFGRWPASKDWIFYGSWLATALLLLVVMVRQLWIAHAKVSGYVLAPIPSVLLTVMPVPLYLSLTFASWYSAALFGMAFLAFWWLWVGKRKGAMRPLFFWLPVSTWMISLLLTVWLYFF